MSHGYVPVQWNRRKNVYDIALWGGIIVYIPIFMTISAMLHAGDDALSPFTLMIRAFASLAFILLTLILCIGPLARLDTRFLPLLYNRRHMGVSMLLVALAHGALVLVWYHGFGVASPITSVFSSPGSFDSPSDIAFQPYGFLALCILFVMAATSHDYWNANLGAPLWKALHMGVYVAYALVIVHVAFGAMQDQITGLTSVMVFASVIAVSGLHVLAGLKSRHADVESNGVDWVDVGDWNDIANGRGICASINDDERVAIFRYDNNKLAAIGNACQHQNGPLAEGRVIDGLITCPWHGYQYQPEDGRSPAPFTEKVPTYELKLAGSRILLNPGALPEGGARPVTTISDVIPLEVPANGQK
jgi:nitrite reductase/ring-hydroxylating ferredoxin subunit